jgi:hypothetical protein
MNIAKMPSSEQLRSGWWLTADTGLWPPIASKPQELTLLDLKVFVHFG